MVLHPHRNPPFSFGEAYKHFLF